MARTAICDRVAVLILRILARSRDGMVLASLWEVAHRSSSYQPRSPADSVLYRIVRDHLETFRAHAARVCDGERLPRFIEEEFESFLRCGWLAGGFARFRCDGCGLDRLVPFSCKAEGGVSELRGRRMAQRAAHLVDHVFPPVPVRQWVLSLPHEVRYVLAWDHALCRALVGVFIRAVLGFLRRRARAQQSVVDGRSGAVAIIQRFGSALNLNVHVHALVVDGVYAEDGSGGLTFHAATCRRTRRWSACWTRLRAGSAGCSQVAVCEHGPDRWAEEAPVSGAPGRVRSPRRRRGLRSRWGNSGVSRSEQWSGRSTLRWHRLKEADGSNPARRDLRALRLWPR